MDSNLDHLQTMMTSHGFSVNTSTLLGLCSASVTMCDMSLPDLDSSLVGVQELLSPQEPPRPIEAKKSNPDSGKQWVHCRAQPLFLLDPNAVNFELWESSYFSEGDDYMNSPTISLLVGIEPHKTKDPTVS
jgi:heat shock transcription factor 1